MAAGVALADTLDSSTFWTLDLVGSCLIGLPHSWSSSSQSGAQRRDPEGAWALQVKASLAEICKNKTFRPLDYIHFFRAAGSPMMGRATWDCLGTLGPAFVFTPVPVKCCSAPRKVIAAL